MVRALARKTGKGILSLISTPDSVLFLWVNAVSEQWPTNHQPLNCRREAVAKSVEMLQEFNTAELGNPGYQHVGVHCDGRDDDRVHRDEAWRYFSSWHQRQFGEIPPMALDWPVVRIENPEASDCSLATLEVNGLYLHFS
jgi:hypothetical protein